MDTLESGTSFWSWLATQAAIVQVAVGLGFVLLLAPMILAGLVVALTQAEMALENVLANAFSEQSVNARSKWWRAIRSLSVINAVRRSLRRV